MPAFEGDQGPEVGGFQRQIPRAPFHVSAGPLEHLCERCGLGLELLLRNRGRRPEHAIGLRQGGRGAGQRSRGAPTVRVCVEATRSRYNEGIEMGVHGIGRGRRQIQLPHLLAYISRGALDWVPACRDDTVGFVQAGAQISFTEPFRLGDGTDRVDSGVGGHWPSACRYDGRRAPRRPSGRRRPRGGGALGDWQAGRWGVLRGSR